MNDGELFSGEIVVSKQTAPYFYMKLILEVETKDEIVRHPNMTLIEFKALITTALKTLFGDVGAAVDVDVLRYDATTGEGILKVPSSGVVQVWSSLTWFLYYGQTRCRFNVKKVSPYLVSLSKDSRHYQHQKIET